MKQLVLDALSGKFPARTPCKETLNHPLLISRVAGFPVWDDTPAAYDAAWRKLSIDIHVPRPTENARRPRVPGGSWIEGDLHCGDLGVYPTVVPLEYCRHLDKRDPEWIWQYDVARDSSILDLATLRGLSEDFRQSYGEQAVLYNLYYTTLFMWGVVTFDWPPFMMHALADEERFDRQFLEPWCELSRRYFERVAQTEDEVIFCHDDLAMSSGPVFAPDWYERHIFSRYDYILEPAVRAGKKIVFVCDGNMDCFLERLLRFPFSAIMFENPATCWQRVRQTWGEAGRGFIGGISTALLTFGAPEEVREHTRRVIEEGRRYPGFIISSCGGLHGNIPLENMLAYFETRDRMGIPAEL